MFAHADVNAGIPVAAGLPGPEAVSCRCFAASSASARFPLGASANEGRYTALAQADCDAAGPASTFCPGDQMNVAVRMVIPLRREFGRMLDVSQLLHDARYACGILDLDTVEPMAPAAPSRQATAFAAEP